MSQITTTTDDPQIPQPDLRFVIGKQTKHKKQTQNLKRGKAQQKQPQLLEDAASTEKTRSDKSKSDMKSNQTN